MQCMQSFLEKRSPWVRTAVSLCAETFSSAAIFSVYGSFQRSEQVSSHCRQPMQSTLSYRIARDT